MKSPWRGLVELTRYLTDEMRRSTIIKLMYNRPAPQVLKPVANNSCFYSFFCLAAMVQVDYYKSKTISPNLGLKLKIWWVIVDRQMSTLQDCELFVQPLTFLWGPLSRDIFSDHLLWSIYLNTFLHSYTVDNGVSSALQTMGI